jgi:hypothetical protein
MVKNTQDGPKKKQQQVKTLLAFLIDVSWLRIL